MAERDLTDAAIPELSPDARAGLAYDAARTAATMAVWAAGYRVRGVGHHETVIEALRAIGPPLREHAAFLDDLRVRRHSLTYQTAGDTTAAEADEARAAARRLFADVIAWLGERRPDLLDR